MPYSKHTALSCLNIRSCLVKQLIGIGANALLSKRTFIVRLTIPFFQHCFFNVLVTQIINFRPMSYSVVAKPTVQLTSLTTVCLQVLASLFTKIAEKRWITSSLQVAEVSKYGAYSLCHYSHSIIELYFFHVKQ